MATELAEVEREVLARRIAELLGRRIDPVNASALVQTLPDQTEASKMIKADREAARIYFEALVASGSMG